MEKIPQVSTRLNIKDQLGTLTVRLGFNRSNYNIEPGLYAIGTPDENSSVIVTANYKLTFDTVRKELQGLDLWLLILDTKGINVWCAAGKGTFGTSELVFRIEDTNLSSMVKHRKVIVPQLGAVGIAAHEVKRLSGFKVIYGPVRVADLPAYLANNMSATEEMRQVHFTLLDRSKLIWVEFKIGLKYLILTLSASILISFFIKHPFNIAILSIISAYLGGTVIGPLLLPWLPGKSFALKGLFAGLLVFLVLILLGLISTLLLVNIGWLLIICSISSFLTMNFTGASTYTSFSGVTKEMKISIPLHIISIILGTIGIIASMLLQG